MDIKNKEAVERQYRRSDNLGVRISLHDKYSVNKQGFGNWIIEQYDIKPNMKILELGAGTGSMWINNQDRLRNVDFIFSDLSLGMLEEGRNNLKNLSNISFEQIDIEDIHYPDDTFDIVIANMMLYHVPDLRRGLSEVRRVLKKNGKCYFATFGENGIMKYLSAFLKEFGIIDVNSKNFTLQNGKEKLEDFFQDIQKNLYIDSLEVSNINDLVDYVLSLACMSDNKLVDKDALTKKINEKMENGIVRIPKEYGMFIGHKK